MKRINKKYKMKERKKYPYRINYEKRIRGMKGGYMGMNSYAAKSKGLDFKVKKPYHTIMVLKNLPKKVRVSTERHERVEKWLMKNNHWNYKLAHEHALEFEKMNKPFPRKNTRNNLIKMGLIRK